MNPEIAAAQQKLLAARRRAGIKEPEPELPPVPKFSTAFERKLKKQAAEEQRRIAIINEAMEIQEQDARAAGKLGYIGRAHAQATLPHSKWDPISEYDRQAGNFYLYVKAPKTIGLPYGMFPRLLLIWITTEVVLTGEERLDLGTNMSTFFKKLGIEAFGGGKRGYIRPLKEQMLRLFNCDIRYRFGTDERDRGDLVAVQKYDVWWLKPELVKQDDLFPSFILLTRPFFEDLFNHAVPLDLRAVAILRKFTLALDLYTWLTYRFSYLHRQTEVPWEALAYQFGSNYEDIAAFKYWMKKAVKDVLLVYPKANLGEGKYGLILKPSPTHVAKTNRMITIGDGESVTLPSQETAARWVKRHDFAWTRFLEELEHMKEASVGARRTEGDHKQRIEVAARRADVPVAIAMVAAGLTMNR